MAHVRSQIRDAVVAALENLPTTGSRVYAGRTRPLAKDHAPTILVYAIEESSDVDAMGANATLFRNLTLAVEGRVIGAETPDAALDRIAAEVEPAIVADPTLGGIAREVTLTATRINAQAPGESQAGEIRMEFRVQYRTIESAPQTAV